MHILAGLVAAIGVVLFLLLRTRNAATAARDVIDVADDVRAAIRRFGFRRKANQNPLDGIDDPRVAAAGIVAAFANMDSAFSQDEITAIEDSCRSAFGCDAEEASQLGAYGRWLVQQSPGNMDEVIRRLGRNLVDRLDADAKRQLFAMIEDVAGVEGGTLSDTQQDAFNNLARQLG